MPVTPKGTKKSRFRKSQRLTNTLFKDFRDDDMKVFPFEFKLLLFFFQNEEHFVFHEKIIFNQIP